MGGMPRPMLPEPLPISAHDLADLRNSGITDQTIRACGSRAIYTETDATNLTRMLGYNSVRDFCRGGGLVYRYFDADGMPNCHVRVKPLCPAIRDGKPRKYESPL